MDATSTTPIPVICERCGAAGEAGEADFSYLGNLLEFAAVPRKLKRKDGWTPILQREFIARLAQTASPQLAVEAMGKCLNGIKKLLKDPGSEGFRDAWERAVELGEGAEARRRIAEQAGIQARGEHLTGRAKRRGSPGDDFGPDSGSDSESEAEGMGDDEKFELLQRLVAKFMRKVGQERAARLAGEVVAADFYLRQVTCLEVAFELMAEGQGLDAWQQIVACRRGGHGILQIADTEMSRILDSARREQWEEMGEPPRPEHPPERYLTDHGTHRTEDAEHTTGGSPTSHDDQRRAQAEEHARNAAAQVAWEASAQEAWEASEHGARAQEAWEASEHGAAQRRGEPLDAARDERGGGTGKKPRKALPAPAPAEEDFADRAMRKAIEAAKRAHPEDFD